MAEKGILEQTDGRLLELQVSVIHQMMRSMGHFHMPCQNCVFAQLNPLEYHILLLKHVSYFLPRELVMLYQKYRTIPLLAGQIVSSRFCMCNFYHSFLLWFL